ncbi:hypothetical protein [Treponema phagedenis]|uniref:hypothetical protein n=1 Tax=Treponema phagedenis TaxID=162 RepID=UPI0011EF77DC|nr:hypothetical protein [Treponema phagedenis]TYT77658.1 hypothetical protein FS559_00175 [Treponema phagedenis]
MINIKRKTAITIAIRIIKCFSGKNNTVLAERKSQIVFYPDHWQEYLLSFQARMLGRKQSMDSVLIFIAEYYSPYTAAILGHQ